jgi:hypothetical protein
MFGDLESRVRPLVAWIPALVVAAEEQEREIKRARKSLEDWRRQEKARKKAG